MLAKDLNVDHYLFDFDGTLVDSMPYWAQAMLNVLNKSGVTYPDNVISIITPMGLDNTCRYMAQLGIPGGWEAVRRMVYGELTPMYENVIPAKPFVRDKLLALTARGKGVHVLTASPHMWVDCCLKRNGLYDLFGRIWTFEDFDTPKTDPVTYIKAAGRLNSTVKRCAFLDDNINACAAAGKSGIATVGVFDETSKDDRPRFNEVCDSFVNDFSEL